MRTAIAWRSVTPALQIVCREVELDITEHELAQGQDVEAFMLARSKQGHVMNLEKAPLRKLEFAIDSSTGKHYVLSLLHHIISDHVGLDVIHQEMRMYAAGQLDSLVEPVPYREFIAHVQHQAEHNDAQAFFTEMLGDVEEPTAPFGLLNVSGDGSSIVELNEYVDTKVASRIRQLTKLHNINACLLYTSDAADD